MQINRNLLNQAVNKEIISQNQAQALWEFCNMQQKDIPHFNFTHILYYFGGLLAIGAMSLFMTLAWETFGGFGITLLASVYMAVGLYLTQRLFSKNLNIPGGILATLVIVCVPLAIYGFQKGMGWWPGDMNTLNYRSYHYQVNGLWILMELGTLFAAAIIFYFYRQPFLLMPVAITLWYISMDLVPVVFDTLTNTWKIRQYVTLYMGVLTVLFAFWVDIRNRSRLDYAFHLYLWGIIMFWGALTSMSSEHEWQKLIYCFINFMMIIIGAALARRVFVVFGALGIILYLGDISYRLFKDSALFPILLTLLGLVIIYFGILWNKYGEKVSEALRSELPKALRDLVERRQNLP